MKNWLKNKCRKLTKNKYVHIAYYENCKKNIKRFDIKDLDIKICISCFSVHLYSIKFLKEKTGINNIYGIKFSNNETESWKTIDDDFLNVYVNYINIDAKDESKGSLSCIIKDNETLFRFDITCMHSFTDEFYKKHDFSNFEQYKNSYLYTDDKELINLSKNYSEIHEEKIDDYYFPRHIILLHHNVSLLPTRKRWFRHHK